MTSLTKDQSLKEALTKQADQILRQAEQITLLITQITQLLQLFKPTTPTKNNQLNSKQYTGTIITPQKQNFSETDKQLNESCCEDIEVPNNIHMSDDTSVTTVKSNNSSKQQNFSSNNNLVSKSNSPKVIKKLKTSSKQGAIHP